MHHGNKAIHALNGSKDRKIFPNAASRTNAVYYSEIDLNGRLQHDLLNCSGIYADDITSAHRHGVQSRVSR